MLNFQIDENFETFSKRFSLFFAKLYGAWFYLTLHPHLQLLYRSGLVKIFSNQSYKMGDDPFLSVDKRSQIVTLSNSKLHDRETAQTIQASKQLYARH